MNENDNEQENKHEYQRRIRIIPLLLSIATVLLAGFGVAAHYFRVDWSDGLLQFDFALVNLAVMGLGLLLAIAWSLWLFFGSGWSGFWSRLVPFLAFLIIVGGLACFRPVFRGGMAPDRWEPRWWAGRTLSFHEETMSVAITSKDPDAFPQYLGPNRDGRIADSRVDLSRIIDAEQIWKRPIGAGWSGFIAANGAAWTMQQNGEYETVQCIDLETGIVNWEYKHKRRHDEDMGGVGPRATPSLDGDKVYAQGANGLLVCISATDGSLIWEQDLSKLLSIPIEEGKTTRGEAYQTEKFKYLWGRSCSPLIVDDKVIVAGGGPVGGTSASLIAFDKLTGVEAWRGGTSRIGYSSPVLMTLDGVRQIVTVNESTVAGYDPESGIELWQFDQPGHSDADANTSQPVQIGTNQVLTSKGYGFGGKLIEVDENNGNWTASQVWASQRVLKTKLTSSIYHDGHIYAISDGILECVDAANGQRIWKAGRYGHGQLLLVGDVLLIHSENGFLASVPATPDGYSELGRLNTVSGVCWNTICLYKDMVLVRSDVEAACFRLPVQPLSEKPDINPAVDQNVEAQGESEKENHPDPAAVK